MFYSHNLLARKEPLGQIWMAATTHAKINRRKLNKLNIIKICEEILNPPVPMALRLSGILMGGVVIVYERKVKLLRDDVNRLLTEINEAWKGKAARDPTLLPKGKCQAKKEAVTLPENGDADIEDDEHPPHAMFFQQTAYFSMGLDSVEIDAEEGFPSERFHQVEAKDITIEHTDSYHASANLCNHFERFDIDDNEDVLMDVTHPQIPESLIPSPPHSDDPQRGPPVANKVHNQNHEHTSGQLSDGYQDIAQAEQRLGPIRRKTRRTAASIMDCEQTIIPGHVYQSWLLDASDIISRRRKMKRANLLSTMKIANLMELPPTVLVNNLFTAGGEIYYPHPLLELWKKSIEPSHGSPSGSFSPPRPLEPVSSTPSNHQEPIGFSFDGTWNDQVQIDEPTEVTFRSKKRPHLFPSARISSSSLEPIEEENAWNSPGPNFKVARRSGLTPDYEVEILMETGPTQTQQQIFNDSVDSITDSIRMQMKAHFDTPGAPQVESLNNLAAEMNRKGAAQLFYHTCVLATRNFLKVEQEKPYGEILISKGSKM